MNKTKRNIKEALRDLRYDIRYELPQLKAELEEGNGNMIYFALGSDKPLPLDTLELYGIPRHKIFYKIDRREDWHSKKTEIEAKKLELIRELYGDDELSYIHAHI